MSPKSPSNFQPQTKIVRRREKRAKQKRLPSSLPRTLLLERNKRNEVRMKELAFTTMFVQVVRHRICNPDWQAARGFKTLRDIFLKWDSDKDGSLGGV